MGQFFFKSEQPNDLPKGEYIVMGVANGDESGYEIIINKNRDVIELWETPIYGGTPYFVKTFVDIFSALDYAENELT